MYSNEDAVALTVSIALAKDARAHGSYPFGSVITDPSGRIVASAENTVTTDRDPTAHAEINAIRQAAKIHPIEEFSSLTLYSSTEPCPMCCGAIYTTGIRRLVFASGKPEVFALAAQASNYPMLLMNAATVFASGNEHMELIGPADVGSALHLAAREVHEGFWAAR